MPAGPNADHLDVLADRLRFQQANARARRLGELLTYWAERKRVAGQQALVIATELLRHHYSTGQQPGEDAHLGALRVRIAPPPSVPLLDAVEAAEREPMGCTSDPAFDRDELQPRVSVYNRAHQAGAAPTALTPLSDNVRAALERVVLRIYDATQWALAHVEGLGLAPLASAATLARQEASSFERFMDGRAAGRPLPLRDKPPQAVYRIVQRETAVENHELTLLIDEPFARAQARLDGTLLAGTLTSMRSARVTPYRTEYRLDLISSQTVLRAFATSWPGQTTRASGSWSSPSHGSVRPPASGCSSPVG